MAVGGEDGDLGAEANEECDHAKDLVEGWDEVVFVRDVHLELAYDYA